MEIEFSFRRTRKWDGWAEYNGHNVRIYLPHLFQSCFFNAGYFGYMAELEERFYDFLEELNWLIIHELCHNLGIRHNTTWTSYEGLI